MRVDNISIAKDYLGPYAIISAFSSFTEKSNINEEVIIELPEEAMNAMELTELQKSLDNEPEKVRGAAPITGNVIAEVFG